MNKEDWAVKPLDPGEKFFFLYCVAIIAIFSIVAIIIAVIVDITKAIM